MTTPLTRLVSSLVSQGLLPATASARNNWSKSAWESGEVRCNPIDKVRAYRNDRQQDRDRDMEPRDMESWESGQRVLRGDEEVPF
jgi:hypothetical protein